MAAIFRQLTLAFGAGAFGSIILALVAFVLARLGVPQGIGASSPPADLPFFYRLLVWGGIWGFLFVLPVLMRAWWLKGIVIGLLATAALIFFFSPALQGAPAAQIGYIIVLNSIWGIAAGAWWAVVGAPRKNGRKFGTFMR
jgi:hypothetical protein